MPLPDFVPPMLATPGEAFDSPEHFFEIKWDGTRCLCFVEDGKHRLVNRRQIDITGRYPDLANLSSLPDGTVLDGEMVVLKDGKPDFALLQSRDHSRSQLKVRSLAKSTPATYIVFDLMYENGVSIMNEPLRERRRHLEAILKKHPAPNVVLSQGVVGSGIEFFKQTTAQNLEGAVAKRLDSRYLPGRRTEAWIKIKKGLELYVVVIGFEPSKDVANDFRSLIVAREDGGVLKPVGKVGTGFSALMHDKINAWLWSHRQAKPVVKSDYKGIWVEPRLVCRVSCMELTPGGDMRAPVFHELIHGERGA